MKDGCTDALCRQCFARIRDGDRSAVDELYDATGTALYRFARSYCRNDAAAEDVVQDTMIRAVQYAADHRDVGGKTWLFTIARNRCIDLLRAQRTEPDAEESAVETDFSPVEVRDALARLTESEQQVIRLRVFAGLTVRETASMLHLSYGKVRYIARCAIQKLRIYYAESEGLR